MPERFRQHFLAESLAEALGGALSRYDDLADEIYELEARLRPYESLGEFMDRCRSFGLPLTALEGKLAARSSAWAEADRLDRAGRRDRPEATPDDSPGG